jgi:N6-adenosine-specific RNA methylase IME4
MDQQPGAERDGRDQLRYRTILADPPWDIEQKGSRGASQHYPLMTLDVIKRLAVQSVADEDAHLWLWVTNATLHVGREVMDVWGFTYKSCLTWVKPRLGLGAYLRNMTEHCLFGVRGCLPIQFKAQPSWLIAPVQDHSNKPEEQYAIIERCSPGPYLELFARRKRPGWHAWGNEVNCDVAL